MDSIDRVAEWRRLKEVYAQMSEEELAQVADEGYQLTDLAKQALTAEISIRHLDLTLKEAPEPEPEVQAVAPEPDYADDGDEEQSDDTEQPFDPEALGLVPFRRVWDANEAKTFKQILDGAGIPSYFGDDNLEQVEEVKSFEGGVDLKVRYRDAHWASATVANNMPQPSPGEQQQTADEDAEQYAVKCPRCGSTEIVFLERDGAQDGNDAFNAKFKWHCDSCNHDWEDEGVSA